MNGPAMDDTLLNDLVKSVLDDLPEIGSFLGLELKTGTIIIATMGVVHPIMFGCTLFMPLSYMLVTMWILLSIYFAASILLFAGAVLDNALLCYIWTWYALVFVALMMVLLLLMTLVFCTRHKKSFALASLLGILWYILTIYFILVVNTHRKILLKATLGAIEKAKNYEEEVKEEAGKKSLREGDEPIIESTRNSFAPILRDTGGEQVDITSTHEQTNNYRITEETNEDQLPKIKETNEDQLPKSKETNEDEVPKSISRTSMEVLVSVPMKPMRTVAAGHKLCAHNHSHEDGDFYRRAKVNMKLKPPEDEGMPTKTYVASGGAKLDSKTDVTSGGENVQAKTDDEVSGGEKVLIKMHEALGVEKVLNKTVEVLRGKAMQNKTHEVAGYNKMQTKTHEIAGDAKAQTTDVVLGFEQTKTHEIAGDGKMRTKTHKVAVDGKAQTKSHEVEGDEEAQIKTDDASGDGNDDVDTL